MQRNSFRWDRSDTTGKYNWFENGIRLFYCDLMAFYRLYFYFFDKFSSGISGLRKGPLDCISVSWAVEGLGLEVVGISCGNEKSFLRIKAFLVPFCISIYFLLINL